ncbi:polymorphic toxin-type HINT domain-containing protein [Longispora urticae]
MRSRTLSRSGPLIVAGLTGALLASLAGAAPALAAPLVHLKPQQERVVPGRAVPPVKAKPDPMGEAAERERRRLAHPAVAVPGKGKATVDLSDAVRQGAGAAMAAPVPVRAQGLPVTVEPLVGRTALRAPEGKVTVELVDGKNRRPGELLLKVTGQSSAARVGIDYSAFRDLYGGDWSSRLTLKEVPDCALSTPDNAECGGTPLPSANNGSKVTTDLAATSAPRLLSLTAGASGGAGSYAASKLSPSATWNAGGSSGDFTWSYAMRTPPTGAGPQPSVSLGYSAQAVDGKNAATNNQPSWVGAGFDYAPGSIERRYKGCADDMDPKGSLPAANQTKTGDLCWATDNAVMSLGGRAGELIYDAQTGWHMKSDDGTKVERVTGEANNNGDNDTEYWKATTTDGTQYFFGRNRLPGWTSDKNDTNSTWTVPVYGNHSDEPCHTGAGWCQQAWKWNLDHVVDIYGNTMTYWYEKETNYYARNMTATAATQYVRGGSLRRIDYGTRLGGEYGTAAAQVHFDIADRCDTNCGDNASWVDTPKDQHCAGTNCAGRYSPTFWTTQRLAKVRTQYWTGTAYQKVDSWTLRHTYPDPDADPKMTGALWLSGITHTGEVGTAKDLPEVVLTGQALDNRVDRGDDDRLPPIKWYRMYKIKSESGAETVVWFKPEDCTLGSRMPGAPETNNLRCYPVKWRPQGHTDDITDYFHKYVVDRVTTDDTTAAGGQLTTEYEYVGAPAWHYTDDDGLIDPDKKTWSQWRGYGEVKTRAGTGAEQTLSGSRYFRGMHGDKLPSGTRNVQVDGIDDEAPYAGMVREQLAYNTTDGSVVTAVVTDPWKSAPTATRTLNGTTVTAQFVGSQGSHLRTVLDNNRGWRKVDSTTWHDVGYGLVSKTEQQASQVDAAGVVTATGAKNCNTNSYVDNPALGLRGVVSRTVAHALPCGTAPTVEEDILGDTEFGYDGQAPGSAPTVGNPTLIKGLKSWSGGTTSRATLATSQYDERGRVKETVDALGVRTTIAYTHAANGPVTQVTRTDHAANTTTSEEINPAWGATKSSTDANGRKTQQAYDQFGQLTGVWLAGRSTGSTPDAAYEYKVNNDKPSVVISRSLTPNGGQNTTYTLYDALFRERQTQKITTGGTAGRLVTDQYYDSVGRPSRSNAAYVMSGSPGEQLYAASDNAVPSQHVTVYDGAGRSTASVYKALGQTKWQTTTYDAGDRTDVTPPNGGVPTSSLTDVEGRVTELRYLRATGAETLKYTYHRSGQLATVTDPTGQNKWLYTYDARGRLTSSTDPDTGTTSSTYNEAGQLLTRKDALQRVLSYEYDTQGRPTVVRDESLPNRPIRTEYGYDQAKFANGSIVKGARSSATRWLNGKAYVKQIDTVDDGYRPTRTSVVIPTEPGLTGTYTTKFTYNANGSPASTELPGTPDMAGEILNHTYDVHGQPLKLSSSQSGYVMDTTYTSFGEQAVRVQKTSSLSSAPRVQQQQTYEEGTRRLTGTLVLRDVVAREVTNRQYTYDNAGKVQRIADVPSGGQADTQCFRYDDLQRLTKAWTPQNGDCAPDPTLAALATHPASYWQSWAYLPNGNRQSQIDHKTAAGVATTTYGYPADGASQPHTLRTASTTDDNGTRVANYEYDVLGNTTKRPNTGADQTLGWDIEGHVNKVDGLADSYVYDAEGGRLIKHEANGDATLYLDGTELRYTKSSNSVSTTRYYQHAGALVASRTSAGLTWLFSDYQGTSQVSVSANAAQTVTTRRQTPYGSSRGAAVTWVNKRGFLGGDQDAGGLTHLGAREYDPNLGRFVSVDPVFEATNPQQINGYAYGDNSPMVKSDPSGLHAQAISDSCDMQGQGLCWPDDTQKTYKEEFEEGQAALQEACSNTPYLGGFCDAAEGLEYLAKGEYGKAAEAAAWAALSGIPPAKYAFKGSKLARWIVRKVDNALRKIPDYVGNKAAEDVVKVGKEEQQAQRAASRAAADERRAAEAAAAQRKAQEPPPKKSDPGADSCQHSFAPDTLVVMADGSTKRIEDVEIGEEVVSTDPETGETTTKTVTALHRNDDIDLTDLTVVDADGVTSTVKTTQHHPFWVVGDGKWVDAGSLRPGDQLLGLTGGTMRVVAVDNRLGAAVMRDLTVADIHTYYIVAGSTPVLVHNCGTGVSLDGAQQVSGRFPQTADPGQTLFRQQQDGTVTAYARYDAEGQIAQRADLDPNSAAHAGIPAPHILDMLKHTNPRTGEVFRNWAKLPRPLRPDEELCGCR